MCHVTQCIRPLQAADPDTDEVRERPAPAAEVVFEDTIETGFVILDGEPLPGPYHIATTDDSVTVNDRVVRQFADDELVAPRRPSDSDPGFGRQPPPRFGPYRRFQRRGPFAGGAGPFAGPRGVAASLSQYLRRDAVVTVWPDHPPKFFVALQEKADLFSALLSQDATSEETRLFLETQATNEHRQWERLITEFRVTEDFRVRSETVIDEFTSITESNHAKARANQRLHSLGYPLTVLGMVLGVVGLGHLLKSFPRFTQSRGREEMSPEIARSVFVSVGLIAVLSLFDLTWTILASQAGQMSELNPIGSRLISDPEQLVIFKVLATLVGCGLLFALRRHRSAQQACWWMCLTCVVLTFRWVMFNSMFVA